MALWAGNQLNTALARGQPALKKPTPQHLWAMCELPCIVFKFSIHHQPKKDQEGLGPS